MMTFELTVMATPASFKGAEEKHRKWDQILGRMEFLFREANGARAEKKSV